MPAVLMVQGPLEVVLQYPQGAAVAKGPPTMSMSRTIVAMVIFIVISVTITSFIRVFIITIIIIITSQLVVALRFCVRTASVFPELAALPLFPFACTLGLPCFWEPYVSASLADAGSSLSICHMGYHQYEG